jgi:hypothetical protein
MQSERRREQGSVRGGIEADVLALLRQKLREQSKRHTRSKAA